MRIMSSKENRSHTRPAPVVQERPKGAPWPFIAIAVALVAGAGLFMASGSSDLAPSPDATGPTAQAPTTTATPGAHPKAHTKAHLRPHPGTKCKTGAGQGAFPAVDHDWRWFS